MTASGRKRTFSNALAATGAEWLLWVETGRSVTPDPQCNAIRSVNPERPTYVCDSEEVKIVGRVIWVARRI